MITRTILVIILILAINF